MVTVFLLLISARGVGAKTVVIAAFLCTIVGKAPLVHGFAKFFQNSLLIIIILWPKTDPQRLSLNKFQDNDAI